MAAGDAFLVLVSSFKACARQEGGGRIPQSCAWQRKKYDGTFGNSQMTEKRKETMYLDTTILSYLFDERESVRTFHKITEKWWKEESQRYGIYTSRDTFAELRNGEYPRKEEVIDFAAAIAECAHIPVIDDIVAQYIQDTLMPNEAHGDAYHLAYASYYNIDYLLTWNCEHLANANKAKHIEVINHRLGLSTPTIVTPMQLFLER